MGTGNLNCSECQSQNYYLKLTGFQCRECGAMNDMDPADWDKLPNISSVKNAIWEKVNKDAERIEQLKENFNFQYADTPQKIYIKFYNMAQFATYGAMYAKPAPNYPKGVPQNFSIEESLSKNGMYQIKLVSNE